MSDPTTPTAPANPKAELFDALVKAGVAPDVAQRQVNTAAMAGMSNADAFDLYVSGKAAPKSKGTDLMTPQENREQALYAGLDKGVNALAFGQGHRIAAATQALLGQDTYRHADDTYRASLDQDQQDHPTASLVGSVAGAVGNPLNEALAPLGVVKAGMVAGALQGSGDAKDDAASQLEGAGAGVLGGALFGGLIHGASKLLGPNAAEKAITQTLAKSPDAMALLDKMVAAGRGKITSLADLSPEFRALADRVANENPDAYAALKKLTDARQADQGARVLASIRKSAGDPNAEELVARLDKQRNDWAKQAYGALRDKYRELPVDGDLESILSKPGMMAALERASKAERLNHGDPTPVTEFLSMLKGDKMPASQSLGLTAFNPAAAEGAEKVTPPQTYGTLYGLMQDMNDNAGAAFNKSRQELGEAYQTIKRGINDHLVDNVKEHADVQKTFGVLARNSDAVAEGAKDWSRAADARSIAGKLSKMSPSEVYGYRHGVASSLIKQAANAASNRDSASPFINAGEDLTEKLKAVFGDEKTMDKFMREMDSEGVLSQLKAATGGSPSARRMADRFKLAPVDIAGGAMMGAISHSPVLGVAGAVARPVIANVRDEMRQASQAQIGKMLTTQGPEAIQALLARLASKSANGPISAATGPASVGILDAFKNYLGQ